MGGVDDSHRCYSGFTVDFLNEIAIIKASCNGMLCCSSMTSLVVSCVCNPVTRVFKLLLPEIGEDYICSVETPHPFDVRKTSI